MRVTLVMNEKASWFKFFSGILIFHRWVVENSWNTFERKMKHGILRERILIERRWDEGKNFHSESLRRILSFKSFCSKNVIWTHIVCFRFFLLEGLIWKDEIVKIFGVQEKFGFSRNFWKQKRNFLSWSFLVR